MRQKSDVNVNKSYGNKFGFLFFQFILKNVGLKAAYGILFLIVPYYVIFRPSVYKRSRPYLKRRFPNDNCIVRFLRLFKYIYTFGITLIDQLYYGYTGELKDQIELERKEELLELVNKKPAIFLMSHVGYWEISMATTINFNKKMNVLLNKNFDKNKRNSFYDLQDNDFNIINVTEQFGGMIELTNALLGGEMIGVMGDRAEQWRSKTCSFLGSPASFPIIAQQLALATGASVITIFAVKNDRSKIELLWNDISSDVLSNDNLTKEEKIQRMIDNYSNELKKFVDKYPYYWFNFFDFWKN